MNTYKGETIVAFGIDEAFAPHLAVTIASVVANAPDANFLFLVVHDGVGIEHQRRIEQCAGPNRVQWAEISDTRFFALKGMDHISRAAYYRLAIPVFAPPEARRAIYLDVDIVVLGDVRELARADLGNKPIGAVFDPGMDAGAFAIEHGLEPLPLGYFNSGMMVIDLEKIRASHAFEHAFEVISEGRIQLRYADQCALNLVLWNQWARLDPVWNMQRRMLIDEPWEPVFATREEMNWGRRPKLIHYTTAKKPWHKDAYHPYTWLYFRYLRRTPYWQEINQGSGTTLLQHARRCIKANLLLFFSRA